MRGEKKKSAGEERKEGVEEGGGSGAWECVR